MVAHDDRHLDLPLPGVAAREDVVETPGILRYEDPQSQDLIGEMQRPLGIGLTADQGAQALGHLPVRQGEARDVPLQARVVVTDLGVDILVMVEDAPRVRVDELGQAGGQAEPERAVQQQHDRTGFLRFVLGNGHRLVTA